VESVDELKTGLRVPFAWTVAVDSGRLNTCARLSEVGGSACLPERTAVYRN
jgi:hypothetical protein